MYLYYDKFNIYSNKFFKYHNGNKIGLLEIKENTQYAEIVRIL